MRLLYGRLLLNRACAIVAKRHLNFPSDKPVQFLIPCFDPNLTVEDFDEIRTDFGSHLFILQSFASRVNEAYNFTGHTKDVSRFKRRISKGDIVSATKSDKFLAWLKQSPGFALTQFPFFLPPRKAPRWEERWDNTYNTFKLRRLDPTFEKEEFRKLATSMFETVTEKVSSGNLIGLRKTATIDALYEVQKGWERLDWKQKQLINLTQKDLYEIDVEGHIQAISYIGKPCEVASVDFREINGNVYADVLALYVGVYKLGEINKTWPLLAPDYGYPMAKVVFANFMFTKKVKPTCDEEWVITAINYIALP